MSGRERFVDEQAFDALLSEWLSEGAHTAPDRIAERAMLEVATTPQEGTRIAAMWSSMTQAPLAWAAVLLALAIGLGVVIGPNLITDEPSPSPSPSTSPSVSPAPSGSPDPNAHQSVTPVGTIEWTRVVADRRIFPAVGAEGRLIGHEIDADFNSAGWWVSDDGINWVAAEPGTEAFWPSAIEAGEDTISVISPDFCGTMGSGGSVHDIWARLCSDGPGEAALYRLESGSWVELGIPPAHPPQADGVVAGSRRLEYAAALDGDNWVAPSLYIVQVPWENVYGTFEWESGFEPGVTRASGPWPFWNETRQLTEIQMPGDRTLIASLETALNGDRIEFTDAETGALVRSVAASLPGWTPDELLRAYRGWGLDDITFIVSRDGEVSEVRAPWAPSEEWYSSGVMTTAIGRYYAASYDVGDDYATTAVHLWTSDDGVTWRLAPLPTLSQLPEWVELAGSPTQLILTTHGPDSVWVTTESGPWTEVIIDPSLAGMATPTDFGWIMNAFDAAAISADGVSWEAIDLPLLPAEPSVAYLNGLFFYGPEEAGNGQWQHWVGTLSD